MRALADALPEGFALRALGGVTLSDAAACAVIPFGVNTENLRTVTALSTAEMRVQADCPQVITEIDNRYLASDVKLWLSDLFDDETTVYFLQNAAEPGAAAQPIALCELDRQAHYDHRTAVLVPKVGVFERRRASYEDFVQVIARLRAPGGCPWDRAQTHHTLRQYMIEEACEAADAMDGDDEMKMADELGDVLLQVVLNSCIGAEHRAFTDRDVTSMAAHKMITRHEHVFRQGQGGERAGGRLRLGKREEEGARRADGAGARARRAALPPGADARAEDRPPRGWREGADARRRGHAGARGRAGRTDGRRPGGAGSAAGRDAGVSLRGG